MPQVTVTIITAATGHKNLAKCLASVQEQNLDPNTSLEHLVVIDGTKHTERVRRYVAEAQTCGYVKISILQLPHPVGENGWCGHLVYAACSFLVKSKYVSFLDEDNWLQSNHVKSMVLLLEQDKTWVYTLRNIYNDEGFVCQDICESLGHLHPTYNSMDTTLDYLVDTNCYMLRRSVATELSWVWNRPARPTDGSMEADRQFFRCLMERYPSSSACTCLHTVNYYTGNRPDSVQSDFFVVGERYMREAYQYGFPWQEKAAEKPVLYLAHFTQEATVKCLDMKTAHSPFEEWQLTLLDSFKRHYELRSAYEECIPEGSTVLFHMWHPVGFETILCLLSRTDIKKVLFSIESPNMAHKEQWSLDLFALFDVVFTYWNDLCDIPNAWYQPFPYRLNVHNHSHMQHLHHRQLSIGDRSVCIVLMNRHGAETYTACGKPLKCLDYLREEYVAEFAKEDMITCYGARWGNHYRKKYAVVNRLLDCNTTTEIMKDYTFTLIIENCNAEGYVSEKIYDAMVAGSIPIYFGNDIGHIPKGMYIDAKMFDSPKSLVRHVKNMSDQDISRYLNCISSNIVRVLGRVSPEAYFQNFVSVVEK